MLGVWGLFSGNAILLRCPGAQVNHLASLGAERPKSIRVAQIGRMFADRAPHAIEPAKSPPKAQRGVLDVGGFIPREVNLDAGWHPIAAGPENRRDARLSGASLPETRYGLTQFVTAIGGYDPSALVFVPSNLGRILADRNGA